MTDRLYGSEAPSATQNRRDVPSVRDLRAHRLSARTALAIAGHRTSTPLGNSRQRSPIAMHERRPAQVDGDISLVRNGNDLTRVLARYPSIASITVMADCIAALLPGTQPVEFTAQRYGAAAS